MPISGGDGGGGTLQKKVEGVRAEIFTMVMICIHAVFHQGNYFHTFITWKNFKAKRLLWVYQPRSGCLWAWGLGTLFGELPTQILWSGPGWQGR